MYVLFGNLVPIRLKIQTGWISDIRLFDFDPIPAERYYFSWSAV